MCTDHEIHTCARSYATLGWISWKFMHFSWKDDYPLWILRVSWCQIERAARLRLRLGNLLHLHAILTTHYILNNHIFEQVQEYWYLGVIISENIKWSTYINKICNKANSTLGFIRRNLKHCNRKFKETAYISLVRSLFDYSSTVWDPHLQKDIDRIENVQRRAARFIYSDNKRTSNVTAMMNELGWKPLNERRKEHKGLSFFSK